MKTLFIYASIFSTSLLFLSCNNTSDEGGDSEETNDPGLEVVSEDETDIEIDTSIMEDLDNSTFNAYLESKNGILIDVRTSEEVANGSIEGAINMDFNNGDFEAGIDSLDQSTPVFVYCQGGTRSGKARDILKENGFLEIYNLKDGYGNWEK